MAEYIYIAQAPRETATCKVGKTTDLVQRLKAYNGTGTTQDNQYQYLYVCIVDDSTQVEKDFTLNYKQYRENPRKEIYLCNDYLFNEYTTFLKNHTMYVSDVDVAQYNTPKPEVQVVVVEKTVKRHTPSLKERGMTRKDVMQKAKKIKNDEFYTRYEDVEKEINMYPKEIWYNKVVFCNCDDAVDDDERKCSAFSLYFLKHFKELGLKKLICTHYNKGWDIFSQGTKAYVAYVCIYEQSADGYVKRIETPPNYDGSFDHPLSKKILNEEADIVCTNPPFSRARDYWKLLIESGKQFLVLSNTAITLTTSYLPYFTNNKVWAGYHRVDWYFDHKKSPVDAPGHWFTNLPVKDRPKAKSIKSVPLKNIPDASKKYDDKKTLLVNDNYIPKNYKQPFAVSVYPILSGLLEMGYELAMEKQYVPYINGKRKFARVLVQKVELAVK